MIAYVNKIGFLPLLPMGIHGWSADETVDPDCGYIVNDDGSWEWALWRWKGEIIRETGCGYGKFFDKKAAFVSKEWWPDFCNYRRSRHPQPEEGTIEEAILTTLRVQGSLITRELRAACGFDGPKMRSRFDGYVTRLQMGCHIVTEDFVYPTDKHGREYGWGWSLLTTPEALYGREACLTALSPEASYERLKAHFRQLLPTATERQIEKLIG